MLFEERGIKKWSRISELMEEEFGIFGKTGKQCRERYHNHLDPAILKREWAAEEQQKLMQLHNEWGNKWALISSQLPGRTDNAVKNQFYSKLRKSIREINFYIARHFKREFRALRMAFIYKVSKECQPRREEAPARELGKEIKNRILRYEHCGARALAPPEQEELLALLHSVASFNRLTAKRRRQRRVPPEPSDSEHPREESNPEHKEEFKQNESSTQPFEVEFRDRKDDSPASLIERIVEEEDREDADDEKEDDDDEKSLSSLPQIFPSPLPDCHQRSPREAELRWFSF